MDQDKNAIPLTLDGEFVRLPGLYRRWEIDRVIVPGKDFHIEEAGEAGDGTSLFVVYRRES